MSRGARIGKSLLDGDPAAFHGRARRTFAACRRAVETELAIGDLHRSKCLPAMIETSVGAASGAANNGAETENHNAQEKTSNCRLPRPASSTYLRRLARRIGRAEALRVEVLAKRRFGRPFAELSRDEAIRLILSLRAVKAGEIDWETVLEESAA